MVLPLLAAAALPAIASALADAAPWIVRELTGSDASAETAGAVVEAVREHAGGLEPAAIAATLADPDKRGAMLAELARIQADATAERERQATERLRLSLEAAANARAMALGSPAIAATQARLAWAVLGLFAATLGGLFAVGVPKESEALVNVMLGVLTAAVAGVIGFYFGSSYGSRDGRQALEAIAAGSGPRLLPFAATPERRS